MPEPAYVYFSWRGRISRKTYWLFGLLPSALYVFYVYVLPDATRNVWIDLLFFTAIAVAGIMINIKRSHDRDRSGWFSLLLLVPIVGLWPLVEFGFFEGTDGSNRFGASAIW